MVGCHRKATYAPEKPKTDFLQKELQGCGRTISDFWGGKAPIETCRKGIQSRLSSQEISSFWKAAQVPSTCTRKVEIRET